MGGRGQAQQGTSESCSNCQTEPSSQYHQSPVDGWLVGGGGGGGGGGEWSEHEDRYICIRLSWRVSF